MSEGVSYAKVQVRVILPEGATNVKYETSVPLVGVEVESHRTFMDTVGRTLLKLTAVNVVDEVRDKEVIVSFSSPQPFRSYQLALSLFLPSFANLAIHR